MKKTSTIIFAGLLYCSAITAQSQQMVVIKTDGTSVVYNLNDVKRVAFTTAEPAEEFASGEGTESSPYIIDNVAQLLLMAQKVNSGDESFTSAYYELSNDIDLAGINWTPIGEGKANESLDLATNGGFYGTFNGNGHTITNLSVAETATERVALYGLFGLVGKQGTVSNLNVKGSVKAESDIEDATEKTYLSCGGIMGLCMKGSVTNCSFEGTVTAKCPVAEAGVTAGGIAGSVSGDMNSCRVTLTANDSIAGTGTYANAGALAGYANTGSIEACKAAVAGCVTAESGPQTSANASASAGGLIGNSFGGNVIGCEIEIDGDVKAYSVPETGAETSFSTAAAGGLSGAYSADTNSSNTITVRGSVKAEGCGITAAAGAVGMQDKAGYGASNISTDIAGTVNALNHGTSASKMLAYAGGVYGCATFQMSSAMLSGCSSVISGTVSSTAGVAAYSGGVAGSSAGAAGDYAMITSTGKVSADAPTFAACGGVIGNAMASSGACYAVIDGQLSVSDAEQGTQIGGVFGAMAGSKFAKKSAIACCALIGGTVEAGEKSYVGGITGMCNGYSMPTNSYWWSTDESIVKHDTGAGEAADYKLAALNKDSLTAAMETMNAAIDENGSYNYKYVYDETLGRLALQGTSTEE